MSRNEQLRFPGLTINISRGPSHPHQSLSQSPVSSSNPSINATNLSALATFHPYQSPDSGCGVAKLIPSRYGMSLPRPSGVQYAPPPPGVQYARARYSTPGLIMYKPTQPCSTYRASARPLTPQRPNTAAVTSMATRQKRAPSIGSEEEIRFKRVKVTYRDETASRRLRIGNLDARVEKWEIEDLFRNYAVGSVDIFHDDGGVYALVVLSSTADVREAIYKLWDKVIGGRRFTIELDSKSEAGRQAQRDREPTRVLRSHMSKHGAAPPRKPASFSSASKLPPHLFHRPRPDTNLNAGDEDVRPELKAVAENRRMYIRDLPFGTTEEILRELLKDRGIENLTIPYDPCTRLYTGYFAFVDFKTTREVPRALKAIFQYSLAGNKIQGSTDPTPPMLREPEPCSHKVSSAYGRLKITNLASGATEGDLRTLFDGLSTDIIIIQKYLNSNRPIGCAFVQFVEIIDSHRAAMRLSENRTATLGLKCIGEASTSYPSLNKDEHERCGIDPQLPSGTGYAKAGDDPRFFPVAQLPLLSIKPGDAMRLYSYPAPTPLEPRLQPSPPKLAGDVIELDLVTHRPTSSVQQPSLRNAMQLKPVSYQPTPSVQPSIPKKQEGTSKPSTKPRRAAKTVRLSPPTVQENISKEEDQDANIFNRTALRDWFWEHRGLSLDI